MNKIAASLSIVLIGWTGALTAQSRPVGGYLVRQGDTEVAWERYTFEGQTLQSALGLPSQQVLLRGMTRYDDGWVPMRYESSVTQFGDSTAFQTLAATFSDSVRWEVTGANPHSGVTPLDPPYSIFRNLAFSHMATLVMRYDRAAGGPQSFQVWIPDGGVAVRTTLELNGTRGSITMGGVPMSVTLGDDGWLERIEVPSQNLIAEWKPEQDVANRTGQPVPRPTPPPDVRETELRFSSEGTSLVGTVSVPAHAEYPIPIAIIVAGSGPTDRNGNSSLGIRTNLYAQLAWRLAERGIAALRYDKRGIGASGKDFDMSVSTVEDFAADVVAAARVMDADQRFDSVVLLGHSEGAMLVTLAANAGAPVRGIGLLAGMGRPFEAVLREQLADQLDSATLTQYDSAMARYLVGENPSSDLPASLRALFAPVNRRFVQSLARLDPAGELARVPVPVLIVQGATDVQIGLRDAEKLHEARPDATYVIIPDANHVFKRASVRGRAAQAAQYTDPSLPVVDELVHTIVDWIRKVT